MKTVTVQQANAVRNAVMTQFKTYVKVMETRPALYTNYDGFGVSEHADPVPWALLWEEGPFEWALNAFTEHVDEEVLAEVKSVLAIDDSAARKVATRRAVEVPSGVTVEPLTSFILAIYPSED